LERLLEMCHDNQFNYLSDTRRSPFCFLRTSINAKFLLILLEIVSYRVIGYQGTKDCRVRGGAGLRCRGGPNRPNGI
jgi:hypothetical protein